MAWQGVVNRSLKETTTMMKITIKLTGRAPMLQRNGRLANPLDPITIELAHLTKKRGKTAEDYRKLLPLEAYGGCWETPEGLIGLPTENVHSSLKEAAKGFKQGKDVERALLFDLVTEPLLINGAPMDAREYCYSGLVDRLFIRTVVINKKRNLRARAIMHNWTSQHTFTLLDDIVNPGDLQKIFVRAGRLIGVGDWRPRFGTFSTAVVSTEHLPEEEAA
jgi:hypothetical protein